MHLPIARDEFPERHFPASSSAVAVALDARQPAF
jgi:hypothetical protein